MDPRRGDVLERYIDSSARDGSFQLVKTQDCEDILKAVQRTDDIKRRVVNTQNSHKYIGSVPNVVAVQWAKEWGVRLFSKEWGKLARNRLKNDPNWNRLRAPQ